MKYESPTPKELRLTRQERGHTIQQAAALIGRTPRQWHNYEAGRTKMDAALWLLYNVRSEENVGA
jgi:hypothetical protein